jgi:hypothetical protein
MNEQELENKIRSLLKTDLKPSKSSLKEALFSISDETVTKKDEVRYNGRTLKSSIINNKITEIIGVWKSRSIVLVPAFILLIFVGITTLSPHSAQANAKAIQKIADQSETIEEPGLNDEDEVIIADLDSSIVDDLSSTTNEF